MDYKLTSLELKRDLSRLWIHVDMDAFFASVEELDNPQLKTVPMAVGGTGMITTANYLVRQHQQQPHNTLHVGSVKLVVLLG